MGYTFPFTSGPFPGHVVEKNVRVGAAVEVCEVGLAGPPRHVAIVPVVRIESQERLQMEGSFRIGRATRAAGSVLLSEALAEANFARMVEADSWHASATQDLGQPEACSPIAQRISASQGSGGQNNWQVAQALEIEPPWPPQVLARTAPEPQKIDDGNPEQPCMDGGLQRLVSDPGWPTSGTFDGARFVQSVLAECVFVQESKLEICPASFPEAVSQAGISPGYSHGQWFSLWHDWSGGAFAIERLVDEFGNSSRIHNAWAAGAERGTRTNASGLEGRDHATGFDSPPTGSSSHAYSTVNITT